MLVGCWICHLMIVVIGYSWYKLQHSKKWYHLNDDVENVESYSNLQLLAQLAILIEHVLIALLLIEPISIALLLIQPLFIEAIFIVTASFFYYIYLFFWFWVSQLLVNMRMTQRSSMINILYYLKWAAILMSYLWMNFVIHIFVKPRFEPWLRKWNVLLSCFQGTYYFWIWIVIISENAYCLQAYWQVRVDILYWNWFWIVFFLKTKCCDV